VKARGSTLLSAFPSPFFYLLLEKKKGFYIIKLKLLIYRRFVAKKKKNQSKSMPEVPATTKTFIKHIFV